jgi:hypothetical protein
MKVQVGKQSGQVLIEACLWAMFFVPLFIAFSIALRAEFNLYRKTISGYSTVPFLKSSGRWF